MTEHRGLSRRGLLGLAGATALAGVPLLSACARGTSASDKPFNQVEVKVPGKYSGRENVVVWSAWSGGNGKALDALVQKFNDSQDDFFVSAQFQGSYAELQQKLAAALQAKTIPDIASLAETTWRRFFLNDTLEPLDQYFGDGFDRSVYVDQLIEEGVAQDKTWWVPFARSTPLFYYNRDLFAKLKLPDRGPQTWTELREWGPLIASAKANGKPVMAHAFTGEDDWQFSSAVWQFGGAISKGLDVLIDTGGAVEAAEFQRNLIFADKFAYLAKAPKVDFQNGLIATAMESTGVLRGVTEAAKFSVGTSFLPKQKDTGVPTGGAGLAIMRNSADKRKKGAAAFLKFLARPENSAQWTVQTGYLPVVKAAQQQPELADLIKKNPNFGVAIQQLPLSRHGDDARLFVPNAPEVIKSGIQKIFSSNQPGQQVLTDVAGRLRKGAEQIKKAYEAHR